VSVKQRQDYSCLWTCSRSSALTPKDVFWLPDWLWRTDMSFPINQWTCTNTSTWDIPVTAARLQRTFTVFRFLRASQL